MVLNEQVFSIWKKIYDRLTPVERIIFNQGFDLGKCEGIAQCTKRIKNE